MKNSVIDSGTEVNAQQLAIYAQIPPESSSTESSIPNHDDILSYDLDEIEDRYSYRVNDDVDISDSELSSPSSLFASKDNNLLANTNFYEALLKKQSGSGNNIINDKENHIKGSLSTADDRSSTLSLMEAHSKYNISHDDKMNNVTTEDSSLNLPSINDCDDAIKDSSLTRCVNESLFRFHLEFGHEIFRYAGENLEIQLQEEIKSDSLLLRLIARKCKDISNLTEVSIDNNVLRFNLTRSVTCRRLVGKLLPMKVVNIISGVAALWGISEGPEEPSLVKFDPVNNLELIILNEANSHFSFNVPEGLAFRLKEDKITFELVPNDVSSRFLKRIEEEVVSRVTARIDDAYLKDDSFLYTRFIHFANNINSESREIVRGMILQMLVRDHVHELIENTRSLLTSTFTRGIVYLQRGKEDLSAFEIISQQLEDHKSVIMKTVLNNEGKQTWLL
ncbi:7073_t:CDS:1, partial [Acaulospora colombiana]